MIRLSGLENNLSIPSRCKAYYAEKYSDLYDWVEDNYEETNKFKKQAAHLLNLLLYYILIDGQSPYDWDWDNYCNYIDNYDDIDEKSLKDTLQDNYIDYKNLLIDVDKEGKAKAESSYKAFKTKTESALISSSINDLYIKLPEYPKVDGYDVTYRDIHRSLPLIPTKQSEISCTTDVSKMTDTELFALYPNTFIRTRASFMYEPKEGITLDPDLGLLIPVDGFTEDQVRDNIIRYPHIFKLTRQINDKLTSFYNYIEIDGELFNILKIWEFLPESKVLDLENISDKSVQIEFIKEYVIRRYLLERDILGIKHKYPVYGELPSYITLFAPMQWYSNGGYDVKNLAITCVEARKRYLTSRNPKIKNSMYSMHNCVFDSYCCEPVCDAACTNFAQFDYLLMRNEIAYNSEVFKLDDKDLNKYIDIYNCGKLTATITSSDTNAAAKKLTYVAICNMWKGSAVRVVVYSMPFFRYISMLQDSWKTKSEEFEYMDIWSKSSKCLILYGLDYVYFKDFQSQLLLQLLQEREISQNKTFIVCPRLDKIQGSGALFNMLMCKLKDISLETDI